MANVQDLSIDDILKMSGTPALEEQLERVYESTPLGPIHSNLVNTVIGINHRQIPLALPQNKSKFGLTFFTRPRCNLTRNNIRTLRQMYPLLNTRNTSIQRIIRCYLDPVSGNPNIGKGPSNATTGQREDRIETVTSPYVDASMVFIPLLTNLCVSLGGWQDIVAETRTTPEGHYREAHSMIDSSVQVRSVFELSATFRNVPGNPVTLLFYYWLLYASAVFEGTTLIPYGDSIYEMEIDYNTRIYHLALDQQGRYVEHILATGASFPLNAPVGALGNYDANQPFNDSQDNVNIRFQCIGMDYNDPITVKEFNAAVVLLNGWMKDDVREKYYIQIPFELLNFFNMRGYPQINPKTMELQWWVNLDVFNRYADQLKQFSQTAGNAGFLSQLQAQDSRLQVA